MDEHSYESQCELALAKWALSPLPAVSLDLGEIGATSAAPDVPQLVSVSWFMFGVHIGLDENFHHRDRHVPLLCRLAGQQHCLHAEGHKWDIVGHLESKVDARHPWRGRKIRTYVDAKGPLAWSRTWNNDLRRVKPPAGANVPRKCPSRRKGQIVHLQ